MTPPSGDPPAPKGVSPDRETTAVLLDHIRQGDESARDRLFRRYAPLFSQWARGRLPASLRSGIDTEDLVQVSLEKALGCLDRFESRYEGAFLAYLRTILLNEIRQRMRRAANRPKGEELPENLTAAGPTPLDEVIGRQAVDSYEAALQQLPEKQRQAVVARIELRYTHEQVAGATGLASPDAARMLVKRAILQIAEAMSHGQA